MYLQKNIKLRFILTPIFNAISLGKKIKHKTKYDYDKNGNLISETDWLGNRISYVYDSLNRVIEKKDQYNKTIEKLEYNDNGTQSKSTDALGNSITYKYDGNKREIEKTDSVGTVVKTSYDYLGNVSSLTDGNGNVTEYTYDYLNRLINVKKINNGIEENTEYTYDLNGNMLTQTTGKVVVRYEYNVGNKVSKKISSIGTEIYKYNGDGTVETKTDKNGVSTNYIYDIHGRVTEEKVGSITIKYTYDKNNNILTLTDSTGTTTRTYDELNSVTSKTVPKIGKIIYKYDVTEGITNLPEGAYAEVTVDKDNKEVIKIYDKAKRLIEVREGNNVTKYSYYDNGNLKKVALPNGYTEEYTYNKDNTLQILINKNSSGAVVEKYIYAYDKAKNIISKEDKKGTTSYKYDSLNRLTKVTEPSGKTIEYTYDKEGNRYTETETVGTTKTKSIYSYDSSNRITGINQTINGVLSNTTAYTYDKNGNTLSKTITSSSTGAKETTKYSYDVLNQLTKVTTSKGTISYAYNGEGYRIYKKFYDGTETRYLYEGDKVSAEFNIDRNNANNSIEKAKNIYGINLISRKTSNEDLYYLYNGHADVTMLVNKAGDIKATYYYDAFK